MSKKTTSNAPKPTGTVKNNPGGFPTDGARGQVPKMKNPPPPPKTKTD